MPGQVDPARLTRAIAALGPAADKQAGLFAGTHCLPRWRGLVAVWFQAARKLKSAGISEAGPAAADRPEKVQNTMSAPPRRVILRPTGGPVGLGDPEPGRSALDQRRAGATE